MLISDGVQTCALPIYAAGRAERRPRPRHRRHRLPAGDRPGRDERAGPRHRRRRAGPALLSRLLRTRRMELFLHQIFSGLATVAIYAAVALAVVIIFLAIDHFNFAMGEMALFSPTSEERGVWIECVSAC